MIKCGRLVCNNFITYQKFLARHLHWTQYTFITPNKVTLHTTLLSYCMKSLSHHSYLQLYVLTNIERNYNSDLIPTLNSKSLIRTQNSLLQHLHSRSHWDVNQSAPSAVQWNVLLINNISHNFTEMFTFFPWVLSYFRTQNKSKFRPAGPCRFLP